MGRHHRARTEELLNDSEVYRLWRSIQKEASPSLQRSPILRGIWLEKHIFHQLYGLGFRTLAGRVRELRGLSGIVYENDVLVFKPGVLNELLIVECKSRRVGALIDKEQVLLFFQRMQDILRFYHAIGYPKTLLPLFVSSVPLDRNAFRFCLTYGILFLQPCFSPSSEYPQMVACRPPLGAMRHLLGSFREKPADHTILKGLLKSMNRLHKATVRYVSPVPCARGVIDGNKLEKAYFDILYRWQSFQIGDSHA